MRSILMAAAALLALAACNRPPKIDEGEMTADEVAAELSDMKIKPGQWEATNEIISASAPGLPPDTLKQMVGQKSVVKNCITPEQAAKPNANFLAAQQNSNCTYQDWSMEGGRMTGTMTCSGGDMPGTVVMTMDGKYGEEAYDLAMNMESSGLPGGMTMTVQARTVGKRVGECT
ncbi:MAG TPA: DUF3617 domain-containing protein [Allosphingosinicella sp.]|nr:DUF3617 domain-containing protein [Allosphingosinicella sp.]